MVSGIEVIDDYIKIYNETKIDKKHRGFILKTNKVNNKDVLELVEVLERDFKLEALPEKLPKDGCRFIVYDFEYETFENPPRNTAKLLLIMWVPDIAPTKEKVALTTTKNAIRGAFTGIQKDIQASDSSSIDPTELRKDFCN